MPTFGEKISALRAERALSIAGLCELAGISNKTLQRIESGGKSYGDTVRAVIGGLHRAAPLTEGDIFDLAQGTTLSEGAIIAYLSRLAPVEPHVPNAAKAFETDRRECHALVDRMLARARTANDVKIALAAMVAAFEAQMPEGPSGPLLTRRGTPRQVAPGVTERTDTHFSTKRTGTD